MNLSDRAGRRHAVCVLILGTAFLLTLLFLAAEIHLLRSPSQRDYSEGQVLWLTLRILDPGSVYRPLDRLPYVVCPYTPLYMLATRLANVLAGNLLMAGRALSLASTLGIGAALALTVRALTSVRAPTLLRWASAAFAGVLPLLMEGVGGWASLMRVDMLALFLMYAGLGIYLGMGQRQRWQYVAGVFFVLALFTKETMLSAPLACLTFGLLVDRRRAIPVSATAALLLAACAIGLNMATHGGFLIHILRYNRNPFYWKAAATQVYFHVSASWPWLAIAAAALLGIWNPAALRLRGWKRSLESRSVNAYHRGVIVAGLNCAHATVLLATVGKMGATYNHFLPWDISICLLCGLFFYRFLATWTAWRKNNRVAAWVCTILLFGLLLPPIDLLRGAARSPDPPDGAPEDEEVREIIQRVPGPIFSENLLLLIQANRPVQVEPATLTFVSLAGQWNEQPYVSLFERQYFLLLVARDLGSRDFYTPAVASAISSAYVLRDRIGAYSLYYPRARMALR